MRLVLRVLAAVFFIATPVFAAAASSDLIERAIERGMRDSGAPGMAYAVIADGEIVESGERGVLAKGGNRQVTQDTVFLLGSVSKSFTALAIMQLVEADQVELDAPVEDYLDEFRGTAASSMTIRQLLSHTSGYSMVQGNHMHDDFAMDAKALERRVARLTDIEPAYRPGSKWDYSNNNYQILGRIIEVVSGQPYADYMEQNVLAPAGMTDSFVHDGAAHANMASGHRPWFGSQRMIDGNMTGSGSAPQGGIVASATDLARFMGIMMNGQDDILSAAGKAQMMQPDSDASPDYGFGWFLQPEQGIVEHSGSNPGYEALATMRPAQRKAVAVLVNGGSGTAFVQTSSLRYGVTDAALPMGYEGESANLPLRMAFILLAALPFLFIFGIFIAWRRREQLRSTPRGKALFALAAHLATALGLAYVLLVMLPASFGVPISAVGAFQPDLALLLGACSVTVVLWALARIAIYATGGGKNAHIRS